MKDNYLQIRQPVLMVGIGGAGSKIAIIASKILDCKCVLISNDKNDLDGNYQSLLIDSNSWVNPSSYKIRSFAQSSNKEIKATIDGFKTIIVITNLAGRGGTAMSPVVSSIAKHTGATSIILFAIMPFGFEKDRIFHAGVSLKRLRDIADATIVIDNDSLLQNNPELTPKECYRITNSAICEVISLISEGHIHSSLNLLFADKKENGSVESSVKDSLEMLCDNVAPNSVKRALLYVMGGENVPIAKLNFIANAVQEIFKEEKTPEVILAMSNSERIKVHLMAEVQETTIFDRY
ncbi:MAG: cell division protein FtsZ, partial [Nitrososphaeraceae archaeon]